MSSSSEAPAVAVATPDAAAADPYAVVDWNKPEQWPRMKCKNAQEVFNFFIDHMPKIKHAQDKLRFLEHQQHFFPNDMGYRNPHSAFDIVQYILACFPRQKSHYRYKALESLVCRVQLMAHEYSLTEMLTLINLVRGDDNAYMIKTANLLTDCWSVDRYKWRFNSETAALILAMLPTDNLRWQQVLYWMKELDTFEAFLTVPGGDNGREWICFQFEDKERGEILHKMLKAMAIPGASEDKAYEAAMDVYKEHLIHNNTKALTGKRHRPDSEEDSDDEPPKKKLRRSTRMQPTDAAKVIVD